MSNQSEVVNRKTDNYNVQKENRQKDKKYSIKRYTQKTEDSGTLTSLNTSDVRFSGRVGSICFTSGTRRDTVKRHEHRVI